MIQTIEIPREGTIPVLVRAPLRRDASLIERVVEEQGILVRAVASAEEITAGLKDHDAVLVCTQEGFTHGLRQALHNLIEDQPAWAQLPVILIVDARQETSVLFGELKELLAQGHVTLLHRPMRPLEFTTAIQNAVLTRRRQLHIRDSLNYEKELQRELNHRVKNTLSTFLAIYHISLSQSDDLADFTERFDARMRALTAVHDLLNNTRDGRRGIDEIARAVLAPYTASKTETDRLTIAGDRLELSREAALSLSLILNELATNAAKYGALSRDAGRVSLDWVTSSGDMVDFRWQESGGPRITAPGRTGYGTSFIQASAQSLRGRAEFDWRPAGLHFALSVPASSLVSGDE